MRTLASPLLPLLLGAILLAAGCASQRSADESSTPREARTTVEVVNNNFYDVNIYVLSSAQRHRLGTVGGGSTDRFTIPPYIVASGSTLRFQADPIGQVREPVSQQFDVFPGDQVRLVIPAL